MPLDPDIRESLHKPEIIGEVSRLLVNRILNEPDPADRFRAARSMVFLLLHHIELNCTVKPEYAARRARVVG
jgi:hypothetical protein